MQFNSGTLPTGAAAYAPAGAFSDPLPDNQRDFLISELQNAVTATGAVRTVEAQNGVRMADLDKLADRLSEDLVFAQKLIAEIENVDLTEAITQLNEDRTALEAARQVVARLTRSSLLDFI